MGKEKLVFTPQLLEEIRNNINRFLPQMANLPMPEGDDVFEHVRNLKFPVTVSLVSGKPVKGLHPNIECFSFPFSPHMQRPNVVTYAVCATIAWAAVKELDMSVIVTSEQDHVGFAFSAGKALDDVLITPYIRIGTGGEILRP